MSDVREKKYLIIGTSAAGLSAAHKIRQLDSNGVVTCITEEKEGSYNKCSLADFLASSIEYPIFKTEKFFQDNRLNLLCNTKITTIDRDNKCVRDIVGKEYFYDALLLATGGSLIRPEDTTAHAINVFDFYTYEQTRAFKEYVQQDTVRTILIIGGGLSGIECADALRHYNKSLVIVEKAERVLAHQITQEASLFLEKRIARSGIDIVTNTTVKDFIIHENKVTQVVFSSGVARSVDMIIYALGARANVDLPLQAGLSVEREGVVVNEYLQTNDSSIWAAGDICRVYNTLTKAYIKSCTWPDAMQQGMYAAHSMVGVLKPYKGAAPVVSSSFFGVKFFVAGAINPRDKEDGISIEYTDNQYTMVMTRHQIVQGFIIFGDNSLFFNLKHSLLTQSLYEKMSLLR